MTETFEDFLDKRRGAASAYVKGDANLVNDLSAQEGNATFFDPGGGFVEGATAVLDAYAEGARMFGPESVTEIEVHDQGSSDDIGYWVDLQRANAVIKGRSEPVEMTLRVSEVFRKQDGEWRMVRRHASMATNGRG